MDIVKVLSNADFSGTILPEHRQGSGRARSKKLKLKLRSNRRSEALASKTINHYLRVSAQLNNRPCQVRGTVPGSRTEPKEGKKTK